MATSSSIAGCNSFIIDAIRSKLHHDVLSVLRATNANVNDQDMWFCLLCPTCKNTPIAATVACSYKPGTCLELSCPQDHESWFMCVCCPVRLGRRRPQVYFSTRKHSDKLAMVNEEATVLGAVTLESREQQQPERMVAVETMDIPQSEHLATLYNFFQRHRCLL
jgi:hypothetical protein